MFENKLRVPYDLIAMINYSDVAAMNRIPILMSGAISACMTFVNSMCFDTFHCMIL